MTRSLSREDAERIATMREQGMTYAQISKVVYLSDTALIETLKHYGIHKPAKRGRLKK